MKTYGMLYQEFISKTKISTNTIDDYRPCCEMFGVPNINNAILIWLKDGTKLIYISNQEGEE